MILYRVTPIVFILRRRYLAPFFLPATFSFLVRKTAHCWRDVSNTGEKTCMYCQRLACKIEAYSGTNFDLGRIFVTPSDFAYLRSFATHPAIFITILMISIVIRARPEQHFRNSLRILRGETRNIKEIRP